MQLLPVNTLQKGDGYFDQYIMVISVVYLLSQHLALNRCVCIKCAECVGYLLSNGFSNG